MRRVTREPHIDCSLCKKIRPPVTFTFGEKESSILLDGKRQKIELSNGEELLFPETKYNPECIPWYEFHCGHRYHVPCLARLNPNKYTDITYRGDDRGTLDIDEFHCIDCRGTQKINYKFNPYTEGHVNEQETSTGTIYINVPEAFERAETDMATFLDRRLEVIQTDLDLRYFIHRGTSRKEIEETVLPGLKLSVIKYLTLEKPTIEYPLVFRHLIQEFALVNRVTKKPLEMHTVSLAVLLDGIDVHWTEKDKDYFRTKKMDINALNLDYKSDHVHIEHLNRIAVPIKRYLHGDHDARKLIHDDDITKTMLYGSGESRHHLCVLNHAGEKKRLVTFDDFPIRETSSCSIMGGTRKTKLIRKRHKTVKNVFRRARTRL